MLPRTVGLPRIFLGLEQEGGGQGKRGAKMERGGVRKIGGLGKKNKTI